MWVSARCDYACRAVLELALHWPNNEPLTIFAISKRQNIPMRYLVQILIQLKRMGLVRSIRGKEGGYILLKPPNEISLGELVRQTGGPLLPVAETVTRKDSVFTTIWNEVESAMACIVDKISFENIADKAKGAKNAIIYQI